MTLPEKFERLAAQCSFAVFILSADDDLVDVSTNKQFRRARPYVILEIGFFGGALGRNATCVFLKDVNPDLEIPGDLHSIGWIPITPDLEKTRNMLRKELEHAGLL